MNDKIDTSPGTPRGQAAPCTEGARRGDGSARAGRGKTEQARLLVQAEAAEARFRALLESAPDAMVTVDRAGQIVLVNSQVEELFGFAREELLGQPIEILVPDRFHQQHVADRQRYTAAPRTRPMGAGLALAARRKDGSEVPVEISLSPLEVNGELLIMSIVRNVTERRYAPGGHLPVRRDCSTWQVMPSSSAILLAPLRTGTLPRRRSTAGPNVMPRASSRTSCSTRAFRSHGRRSKPLCSRPVVGRASCCTRGGMAHKSPCSAAGR